MFEDRLREVFAELEQINYEMQQGCIDVSAFDDIAGEPDHEHVMATFDEKIGVACSAVDNLLTEFYEEGEDYGA